MPNRHERRLARRNGDRTPTGFARFARERPLLVAGAGIALGMAFGALLPWRIVEDEYFGEQAERLKDSAVELANDGYEKAKSVAQRGYETAAEMMGGTRGATGSSESPASTGFDGGSTASARDRYHS
ncbi:MAG: hypothetical protein ACJ8EL_19450 [Rhizomicrobium sp.]|jgi:hypothetical protein